MLRRVLDLFCGAAGGWSLGVGLAGWHTVAAAESDPIRRAIFAQQHSGVLLYDDVQHVTADRLRADLGYLPDIVVGSPPCQDISAANSTGAGIGGDRSGLYWEAVRIVDEVRPRWAVFENSPRLRTGGADPILACLDAIGYACWPLVVGAAHAGANHGRSRSWLIARHADGRREAPEPGARGGTSGGTAGAAADAPGAAGPGRSVRWGEPRPVEAADATGAGHQVGPGEGGDAVEELPLALRAIGDAWPAWNGGTAGLAASCAAARPHRMDDGLSARLAVRARNVCIAAYGDAVVPEIARAIAAAIDATERRLRG